MSISHRFRDILSATEAILDCWTTIPYFNVLFFRVSENRGYFKDEIR